MGQSHNAGGVAAGHLRAFIERIERIEEDKAAIRDDIKAVYAEAKANGFNTKVMRQLVKIRKQDRHERAEQEAILELYMHALGMLEAAVMAESAPVEVDPMPRREPTADEKAARNPVGFDLGEGV